MERYTNRSGNSPITHYQIYDDRIAVWFRGGKKNPYVYPEYKTGSAHLQQLKRHAISGSGLSAYITQNVREKFIQ
jgi:hypothetical protein